jgi:GT2 family glycosyltransferase
MGFNEEFLRLEDMDLALRASKVGMKFCTSENILVVRFASKSDSKSPLNEAISQQRLLDEHFSSLGKRAVLTLKLEIVSRRFYFEKRFVRFCLWGILLILVSHNRRHKLHSLLKRLTHDLRK